MTSFKRNGAVALLASLLALGGCVVGGGGWGHGGGGHDEGRHDDGRQDEGRRDEGRRDLADLHISAGGAVGERP